jgi:WD40 repeat protein
MGVGRLLPPETVLLNFGMPILVVNSAPLPLLTGVQCRMPPSPWKRNGLSSQYGYASDLEVYALDTSQRLSILKCDRGYVRALAITPDGKRVIAQKDDGLKVWDVDSGCVTLTLKNRDTTFVVTADGKSLVTAHDGTVRVWDVDPGKSFRTFTYQKAKFKALAVEPEAKRLVSLGSDELKVWDMDSGTELRTFKAEEDYWSSLALSPTGTHVVCNFRGSYSESVRHRSRQPRGDLHLRCGRALLCLCWPQAELLLATPRVESTSFR